MRLRSLRYRLFKAWWPDMGAGKLRWDPFPGGAQAIRRAPNAFPRALRVDPDGSRARAANHDRLRRIHECFGRDRTLFRARDVRFRMDHERFRGPHDRFG